MASTSYAEILVSLPEDAREDTPLVTQVRLQASEPWHLNDEYPISLDLDVPDGVDMARWHFDREAASGTDAKGINFDLEYIAASSGEKHFHGHMKFAVCSADSCLPQRMPVKFQIDVRNDACGTGLC